MRCLLVQEANVRTIQERLGGINVKAIWVTPISCRDVQQGYEDPRTYLEEQRDLKRTAYQSINQVAILANPCRGRTILRLGGRLW